MSAIEKLGPLTILSALLLSRVAWPAYSWWRDREEQFSFAEQASSLAMQQSDHSLSSFPVYYAANFTASRCTMSSPFLLRGLCDTPSSARFCDSAFGSPTVPIHLALRRYENASVTHFPFNMDPVSRIKPVPGSRMSDALNALTRHTWDRRKQPLPQIIQWIDVGIERWNAMLSALPQLPPQLSHSKDWLDAAFLDRAVQNEFLVRHRWRLVSIGNAGGGMFNHRDTLSAGSFQWQLRGDKLWSLCSNDVAMHGESLQLDPDGDPGIGRDLLHGRHEGNLGPYCRRVLIKRGELLYYPPGTWHQTMNVPTNGHDYSAAAAPDADAADVSIALSETVATPSMYLQLYDDLLREECLGGGVRVRSDGARTEALCAALPGLLRVWGDVFTSAAAFDEGGGGGQICSWFSNFAIGR